MADYQTNPLSVDLYSRIMANAFDEKSVIGVPTAFQCFFGRPETNSQTIYSPNANAVDIDIIRANERIAALVPRGTNGRFITAPQENTLSQRFTNINRVFPLVVEEGDIEASQLLNRLAGENPYERRARRERLRALALREHQEQVRRTVRLFEVLAAQSVLEGKMDAILGTADPDQQYDFLRNSAHFVTLITQWSNAAADALGDIDDCWDLIRENAHVSADMAVFGEGAFEAFLKNTDLIAKADNRRFELILVSQEMPVPSRYSRFIEAGMTARGRLLTPRGHEIWMFTYSDVYTNSAGTATKYMPNAKVLVCYSGARADRYFGPPELLPDIPARRTFYQQLFGFDVSMPNMPPNINGGGMTVEPGMFFFDAYAPESWQRVTARMQAAPIFATTQTDAFAVILNAV